LILGGVLSFSILTSSCSLCFGFEIFLAFLSHFAWLATFYAFVGLAAFLFLDDLFLTFFGFLVL
jgi:hypothetical protein